MLFLGLGHILLIIIRFDELGLEKGRVIDAVLEKTIYVCLLIPQGAFPIWGGFASWFVFELILLASHLTYSSTLYAVELNSLCTAITHSHSIPFRQNPAYSYL